MLPLPTQLKIGGFDLHQLERQGDCAIFEQRQGGTLIAYEVIRVQKRPAQTIMGKAYPPREGYPSNEQWGRDAWTCMELERARERFQGLLAT